LLADARDAVRRAGSLAQEDVGALCARARGGDVVARDAIVDRYMPLAAKVARMYVRPLVPLEDCMQLALLGLLNAIQTYRPERGMSFVAFAPWPMRSVLSRTVPGMETLIAVPVRVARARVDIPCLLSLDQPLDDGRISGEGRGEMFFADILPSSPVVLKKRGIEPWLRGAWLRLDDRERWILYHHFGLDGESWSLQRLADDLGVTRERVRQIEVVALRRLRVAFADAQRLGARG